MFGSTRDTFLSNREVIERVVARNEAIVHYLCTLQRAQTEGRTKLFVDEAVNLQAGLSDQLREYLGAAPAQVLDTYLQYSSEEAPALDQQPHSLEEIVQTTLSLNRQLAEELVSPSMNQGTNAAQEAFANIRNLIEQNGQQLSLNALGALDA